MKNILFLTPRMPFPVIGGDRIKSYNLLKHLAKNHKVTLVTFYQGNENYEIFKNKIEELGIKVYVVKLNPLMKAFEILFRFLGDKPLEILYYFDYRFKKIVDNILKTENIDIAFGFFMRTAEYLKNHNIPKVLIAEDCRRLYQYRSYSESDTFIQKFVRWWEYKKLSKYETKTMLNFDLVTFVTEKDIQEINQVEPEVRTALLTNGTEITEYEIDETIERKGLLFVGKLDLWANQMMIDKILKYVMPDISKKYPDILFSVVGANPPNSLYKIENKNVKIFADVPDVISFYQQNLIFLHPHVGATGIQNKVLEAMASAMAVVTTTTGNQGIDATHRDEVMISQNMDDFKNLVLELLEKPEMVTEIGKKARKLIVDTHSWDSIFKELDKIIERIAK